MPHSADPYSKSLTEQTQAAAKTTGIGLHVFSVKKVEEFERAFATMAEHRDEGVIVQGVFTTSFGRIAQLGLRYHLLSISSTKEFAEAGGLLAYGEVAARALGVRLQFVEARGPADFDRAFSDMTRARAGALTVLPSTMFVIERRRLVDLAAKNRLPTVFTVREYVDAGGLMSYGSDVADLFRRAATYVDNILKGTKPGDLPVEQPTKFELVINLKTAKALGLTIPPSLLLRADQIIE